MLLKQFKKVIELDHRISDMHRELTRLYETRSHLIDQTSQDTFSNFSNNKILKKSGSKRIKNPTQILIKQYYDYLDACWGTFGIAIPSFDQLKSKLTKALTALDQLSMYHGELHNSMTIILIPPAKILSLPVSVKLRIAQGFTTAPDYMCQDITMPKRRSSWRVLVVHAAERGLSLGSPKQIVADKSYLMAGYDTRSLGVQEYAALSLQVEDCIDDGAWTALLKDYKNNDTVVCAGFIGDRFRYDIDDSDDVFENNGYRPAIEV